MSDAGAPLANDGGLLIRDGAPADVPQVLALWEQAGGQASATDTEQALEDLLSRDPDALLVVQVNGELVGSLIAGWDGWRGSFYRLAVHPSVRRQGIATALVRAGETRLQHLGARRLTAIVASDEEPAMNFWSQAGYEHQAARSRFVRMVEH